MTSLLDWDGWHDLVAYCGMCTGACWALVLVALGLRRKWPNADWRLGMSSRTWRLIYFRTLRVATLAALGWGMLDPWHLGWANSVLVVLLVSALAVWFWDRRMCGQELIYWLLFAALTIFVTPAGVL